MFTLIKAEFVGSYTRLSDLPLPVLPEYAFIGRSNVGKSSLINLLCGQKGLAKTSGTPGKTKTINHFRVNDMWYLVDLPGLGYAKTSRKLLQEWEQMISSYLLKRQNLMLIYLLIDIRLEPQKIDQDFIRFLGKNHLAFRIVFTKADKLSVNEVRSAVRRYQVYLEEEWESLPLHFITSARKGEGREELLKDISDTNSLFKSIQ